MITKEIDGKTYYLDSKGGLIPSELVSKTDLERDKLVNDSINKIESLLSTMNSIKTEINNDINKFVTDVAKDYKVKIKGDKGSMSFTSFDGRYKIEISQNTKITFNEGIYLAKQLIDEYLTELTSDSKDVIKKLINSAFKINEGSLNTNAILKLRYIDIDDKKWKKAIDIINKSMVISVSNKSIRFYKKDQNNKYQMINLDFNVL